MTRIDVSNIGQGFVVPELKVRCLFVGAASAERGDLVALCINDADDITNAGETINPLANGTRGSIFSCVTGAYSYRSIRHGIFGVLQEDATSLGTPQVVFRGRTLAKVRSRTNGTWQRGIGVSAGHTSLTNGVIGYLEWTNSGAIGEATSNDTKTLALVLESTTSLQAPTSTGLVAGTSAEVITVIFDGINGIGSFRG